MEMRGKGDREVQSEHLNGPLKGSCCAICGTISGGGARCPLFDGPGGIRGDEKGRIEGLGTLIKAVDLVMHEIK